MYQSEEFNAPLKARGCHFMSIVYNIERGEMNE